LKVRHPSNFNTRRKHARRSEYGAARVQSRRRFRPGDRQKNFKEARALLAPWLQKQVTAKQLQTVISNNMIEDVAPDDCTAIGNDSTLEELRSHYREYHKDDPARMLTTTTEFGTWGPPSVFIANEITDSNFRQWMWIDFTPDPESDTMVDFCLRVYVIVVELNGEMKIGYVEPGE
jgi:hypothetical protein